MSITSKERQAFLDKIDGQTSILSRAARLHLTEYAQAETDPALFEKNLDAILKKTESNPYMDKTDQLCEALIDLENKTTARVLLNKLLDTAQHLETYALAQEIDSIGHAFQRARILLLPDEALEKELAKKVDKLASQAIKEREIEIPTRIYGAFIQDLVSFDKEKKPCPVLDAHILERILQLEPKVASNSNLGCIEVYAKALHGAEDDSQLQNSMRELLLRKVAQSSRPSDIVTILGNVTCRRICATPLFDAEIDAAAAEQWKSLVPKLLRYEDRLKVALDIIVPRHTQTEIVCGKIKEVALETAIATIKDNIEKKQLPDPKWLLGELSCIRDPATIEALKDVRTQIEAHLPKKQGPAQRPTSGA